MAPDIFADGGVSVEVVGYFARVTWYVIRGDARIPIEPALVIPVDSLRGVAGQFAAAIMNTPDDMGRARGTG